MATSRHLTLSFLESLLEGNVPTDIELETLAKQFGKDEGQWIEWKSGLLSKESHCKAEIRKALSSFANAEGGVLVLGCDEKTKLFDPFRVPGGEPAAVWIPKVLSPMPTIPTPRIHALTVQGSPVVIVAVGRSSVLIPCSDFGEMKYFFRLGHQSIEAPTYLLMDLMLGRRQRPDLGVELMGAPTLEDHDSGAAYTRRASVRWLPTVVNNSLSNVRQPLVGIVHYTLNAPPAPPPSLLQWIDVEPPPLQLPYFDPKEFGLSHEMKRITQDTLSPFEKGRVVSPLPAVLPFQLNLTAMNRSLAGFTAGQLEGRLEFGAAVYVLAEGVAPQWHQLTFTTTFDGFQSRVWEVRLAASEGRPKVFVRLGVTP